MQAREKLEHRFDVAQLAGQRQAAFHHMGHLAVVVATGVVGDGRRLQQPKLDGRRPQRLRQQLQRSLAAPFALPEQAQFQQQRRRHATDLRRQGEVLLCREGPLHRRADIADLRCAGRRVGGSRLCLAARMVAQLLRVIQRMPAGDLVPALELGQAGRGIGLGGLEQADLGFLVQRAHGHQ
ncbi:hypothetical protein FQZ97_964490 [compost metagenome]